MLFPLTVSSSGYHILFSGRMSQTWLEESGLLDIFYAHETTSSTGSHRQTVEQCIARALRAISELESAVETPHAGSNPTAVADKTLASLFCYDDSDSQDCEAAGWVSSAPRTTFSSAHCGPSARANRHLRPCQLLYVICALASPTSASSSLAGTQAAFRDSIVHHLMDIFTRHCATAETAVLAALAALVAPPGPAAALLPQWLSPVLAGLCATNSDDAINATHGSFSTALDSLVSAIETLFSAVYVATRFTAICNRHDAALLTASPALWRATTAAAASLARVAPALNSLLPALRALSVAGATPAHESLNTSASESTVADVLLAGYSLVVDAGAHCVDFADAAAVAERASVAVGALSRTLVAAATTVTPTADGERALRACQSASSLLQQMLLEIGAPATPSLVVTATLRRSIPGLGTACTTISDVVVLFHTLFTGGAITAGVATTAAGTPWLFETARALLNSVTTAVNTAAKTQDATVECAVTALAIVLESTVAAIAASVSPAPLPYTAAESGAESQADPDTVRMVSALAPCAWETLSPVATPSKGATAVTSTAGAAGLHWQATWRECAAALSALLANTAHATPRDQQLQQDPLQNAASLLQQRARAVARRAAAVGATAMRAAALYAAALSHAVRTVAEAATVMLTLAQQQAVASAMLESLTPALSDSSSQTHSLFTAAAMLQTPEVQSKLARALLSRGNAFMEHRHDVAATNSTQAAARKAFERALAAARAALGGLFAMAKASVAVFELPVGNDQVTFTKDITSLTDVVMLSYADACVTALENTQMPTPLQSSDTLLCNTVSHQLRAQSTWAGMLALSAVADAISNHAAYLAPATEAIVSAAFTFAERDVVAHSSLYRNDSDEFGSNVCGSDVAAEDYDSVTSPVIKRARLAVSSQMKPWQSHESESRRVVLLTLHTVVLRAVRSVALLHTAESILPAPQQQQPLGRAAALLQSVEPFLRARSEVEACARLWWHNRSKPTPSASHVATEAARAQVGSVTRNAAGTVGALCTTGLCATVSLLCTAAPHDAPALHAIAAAFTGTLSTTHTESTAPMSAVVRPFASFATELVSALLRRANLMPPATAVNGATTQTELSRTAFAVLAPLLLSTPQTSLQNLPHDAVLVSAMLQRVWARSLPLQRLAADWTAGAADQLLLQITTSLLAPHEGSASTTMTNTTSPFTAMLPLATAPLSLLLSPFLSETDAEASAPVIASAVVSAVEDSLNADVDWGDFDSKAAQACARAETAISSGLAVAPAALHHFSTAMTALAIKTTSVSVVGVCRAALVRAVAATQQNETNISAASIASVEACAISSALSVVGIDPNAAATASIDAATFATLLPWQHLNPSDAAEFTSALALASGRALFPWLALAPPAATLLLPPLSEAKTETVVDSKPLAPVLATLASPAHWALATVTVRALTAAVAHSSRPSQGADGDARVDAVTAALADAEPGASLAALPAFASTGSPTAAIVALIAAALSGLAHCLPQCPRICICKHGVGNNVNENNGAADAERNCDEDNRFVSALRDAAAAAASSAAAAAVAEDAGSTAKAAASAAVADAAARALETTSNDSLTAADNACSARALLPLLAPLWRSLCALLTTLLTSSSFAAATVTKCETSAMTDSPVVVSSELTRTVIEAAAAVSVWARACNPPAQLIPAALSVAAGSLSSIAAVTATTTTTDSALTMTPSALGRTLADAVAPLGLLRIAPALAWSLDTGAALTAVKAVVRAEARRAGSDVAAILTELAKTEATNIIEDYLVGSAINK